MNLKNSILTLFVVSLTMACNSQENHKDKGKIDAEHVIIYHAEGRFAGWPANSGPVILDNDRILTGFTEGGYQLDDGHNITKPYFNMLAGSDDGGKTWTTWDPEGFVGDLGERPELKKLEKPLDFETPGFVMRIVGTGYHGAEDPRAHFFYSMNGGESWMGPFGFAGFDHTMIPGDHNLTELTPRTDYIITGAKECIIFMSARQEGVFGSDRLFCISTRDGGQSFNFLGWVVKPFNPEDTTDVSKVDLYDDEERNPYATECRAVMSSSVMLDDGTLMSAVRRKFIIRGGTDQHWLDLYVSKDGGKTWAFRSTISDTGPKNGNPPALAITGDGRLCVVYGNRKHGTINTRYSDDRGRTWTDPIVLLDEFWSEDMELNDLGYPGLVRRSDGKMVAMVYYSTREHLHHLRAIIWEP